MSKKAAVPDAWDDDWESLADKQNSVPQPEDPPAEVKISKSERKAKHQELNKQLWDSAENADSRLFLEAKNNVPLKSTFKPSVTVLSRKPPPKVLSRNDATSGMGGLKLDDDEDSEEEARKRRAESVAEQRVRTQREREEKQRKYNEVREKLFGTSATPAEESQGRASPSRQSRGKGKGRGGRDSQPSSSNDQSPARAGNNQRRQLYDPAYSIKPNSVYIQKKEAADSGPGSRPATPNELQPIREPRGPNSSGRGGFGFAPRGGATA
ncbi:uncharacterized protein BDZ99DRAFT_252294 [Mytilinidion resinicola]|uniref:SUZ domain-containing protein n=1 Tax=Mytilinidion resinicola TaxID=574789 RepID=A0A6A6YXG9_9PEZI|nr:uncharacterized protein BDZ99DRAFT_252294 [Mytilinidion resinicola]KAF2813258.1 hypothetical protein BDZ99DRAFT_252294 [Mytilinidion resinicola]